MLSTLSEHLLINDTNHGSLAFHADHPSQTSAAIFAWRKPCRPGAMKLGPLVPAVHGVLAWTNQQLDDEATKPARLSAFKYSFAAM